MPGTARALPDTAQRESCGDGNEWSTREPRHNFFVITMARGAESIGNQSEFKNSPCFYQGSSFFLDYISSFLLKKLGDIFQIFPKWASRLCFNHSLEPDHGWEPPHAPAPGPSLHLNPCHHTRRNCYIYTHLPSHTAPSHPEKIFAQWQHLINTYFLKLYLLF